MVPRLVDDAAWGDNIAADEFMLQPGGIDAITEFWNGSTPGLRRVGLHGDFNMTGSFSVEALLRLAAPVPDWRDLRSLSGFGSGEWFGGGRRCSTSPAMFVIGYRRRGAHPAHQQRPAQRPHRGTRSLNTGDLMYWADQLWYRPLTDGTRCH